jgi:hypothetical protein
MRPFAIALLGATISCPAMTASQTPAQAATPAAAQTAAFVRYHTFSFARPGQPPSGHDVSERSLQAEEREKSDVVVRLSSGTRELLLGDPETGFPLPYAEELTAMAAVPVQSPSTSSVAKS